MTNSLPPDQKSRYVRDLFTRVAPRYDLMNRLMTGGMDVFWRCEVIRRANLSAGDRLLDLGAGTGDLSHAALHFQPQTQVVTADFTLGMMRAGRQRRGGKQLTWCAADALHLPYADASFDALISGFLLRNVVDLPRSLNEQVRVLRTGGRWVALDTTRPQPNLLSPLIRFYMRRVIPFLGTLLTRQRDAYVYLPETSEHFLAAAELEEQMRRAGLKNTGYRLFNFGTIAIHWGVK